MVEERRQDVGRFQGRYTVRKYHGKYNEIKKKKEEYNFRLKLSSLAKFSSQFPLKERYATFIRRDFVVNSCLYESVQSRVTAIQYSFLKYEEATAMNI